MNYDSRLFEESAEHLIIEDRMRRDIVVGAPHHARVGKGHLPTTPARPADENTGLIAHHVSAIVDCASVTVVNAAVDPNKDLGSPYSTAVLSFSPRLVLEIHGHRGKDSGRANFDIEISGGAADRSVHAERFANLIRPVAESLKDPPFTVSGIYEEIFFKASKTPTIAGRDWVGLHIELPPILRIGDQPMELPLIGAAFAESIAAVLLQFADESIS